MPVVLSIHGGPEAQERPLYHPLYQYLLSRGIAVLATNIRGSTGYGKSYQRLDPARLGRRRHAGLGARRQVAARAGLGRPRADRRLRRLVRRLRQS